MALAAWKITVRPGLASPPTWVPAHMGSSSIDEDTARAFLRRAAATPATVARAALGGTVRNWQGRTEPA